jgi:hypothetical protein
LRHVLSHVRPIIANCHADPESHSGDFGCRTSRRTLADHVHYLNPGKRSKMQNFVAEQKRLMSESLSMLEDRYLQAASSSLEKILASSPSSIDALRALAEVRRRQGRVHDQIALLETVLVLIKNARERSDAENLDGQDIHYLNAIEDEQQRVRSEYPSAREVDFIPDEGASVEAAPVDNPWAFLMSDLPTLPLLLTDPATPARTAAKQGDTSSRSRDTESDVGSFITISGSTARHDEESYASGPDHECVHDRPPSDSGEAFHADQNQQYLQDDTTYGAEDFLADILSEDADEEIQAPEQFSSEPAWDRWNNREGGAARELQWTGDEEDDLLDGFLFDGEDSGHVDELLPPCHADQESEDRISREERARQVAIQVAIDYGWGRNDVDLLAEIFERHHWGAAQVAIRRAIDNGMTPKELSLADEIRQMWFQRCDFWAAVYGNGAIVQRCSNLSWPASLSLLRSFQGYPQVEEVEALIDDCLDQWSSSATLQQQFPAFATFVLYRSGARGDLAGFDGWVTFEDYPSDDEEIDSPLLTLELSRHGIQVDSRWRSTTRRRELPKSGGYIAPPREQVVSGTDDLDDESVEESTC